MEVLPDEQREKIRPFVDALIKWNRTINLIGRKTESEIWKNHIQDSLFLLPFLDRAKTKFFVDIGSGGGFPILPLALIRPDFSYIVTDVIGKKLSWLDYIAAKLDLPIKVVNPTQNWILDTPCTITSRAFSKIKNICIWKKKHTPQAEQLILLKGKPETAETEVLDAGLSQYQIIPQKKGCVVLIQEQKKRLI